MFVLFNVTPRDHFTSDIQRNTAYAVVYFFFVSLAFQWREKILLNSRLLVASGLVVYANIIAPRSAHQISAICGHPISDIRHDLDRFVQFPKIGFLQSGDYSYGIDLYGYPISEALVATFEPLRGHPYYQHCRSRWHLLWYLGLHSRVRRYR